MPTRTQGTNALDPGSITSASLPTYTHRAIHAVAVVTLPVRSSEPARTTPSADVASTRYAGYMGSPSSSASEWSASSHLANTIAWRHTSKPRDEGWTSNRARPGASAEAHRDRNSSRHSSARGKPSTSTSRLQKFERRNHAPHAATPPANMARSTAPPRR